MGFSSSKDKAASEGGEMVEENALQASLFDQASTSVGGEENAVNNSMESMESVDQDNVNIPMPDIPPPCQCLSIQSQADTGNKSVEEVTPNIHSGLRRAEDLMKAQKTKNLLNKNKERTSIARAIVKLVERQDLDAVAASMSMMLMRQLGTMNSSLDRREQQERRERKKRKLCKKRRAMKKAKKAKKATLAGLDDHGGKAGQDSSSSSSSDSNSSNSDNNSSSDSSQSSNYGRGSWQHGGDIAVEDK